MTKSKTAATRGKTVRLTYEDTVRQVYNEAKLPFACCVRLPGEDRWVMVKRGEQGYYPLPPAFDAELYNHNCHVEPAQMQAMLAGSMFGFHTPAADPDTYTTREG